MRTEPNRSGFNNWNTCNSGNCIFSPADRSWTLFWSSSKPEPEILLTIRGEGGRGGKIRGATSLKPKYSISVRWKSESRRSPLCGTRIYPANTRFSLRKESRDGDPHLRIRARRGWDTMSLRGLWGDPPSSTLTSTYGSWVFIVNNQHARDAALHAA